MNQSLKQKNKFGKLELDLEDERIGYQIPRESLKDIQSRSQQMKSIRLNNVIKVGKLGLTTTLEVLAFFYDGILKSSIKFLTSKITMIINILKEKEEEVQIVVHKVIKAHELHKTIEEEELQLQKLSKNKLLSTYYSQMETVFLSTIDSNRFEMADQDQEIVKLNMDQQMILWSYISKKLIVSNMISNAKNIKINTVQKSNQLTTEMIISMEKKGYLWSMMFGKHIVPELSNLLKRSNGKLKVRHTENRSLRTDQFTLTMTCDIMTAAPVIIKVRPPAINSEEVDRKFMSDKINNESVV